MLAMGFGVSCSPLQRGPTRKCHRTPKEPPTPTLQGGDQAGSPCSPPTTTLAYLSNISMWVDPPRN